MPAETFIVPWMEPTGQDMTFKNLDTYCAYADHKVIKFQEGDFSEINRKSENPVDAPLHKNPNYSILLPLRMAKVWVAPKFENSLKMQEAMGFIPTFVPRGP